MDLSRLLTRTTAIAAIVGLALVLRITLAASLTVDTTSDTVDGDTSSIAKLLASKGADGRISLREAITAANNSAASGPHTITLGAGTYALKSGALPITTGLTLSGAGVDSTTISGSSAGRVFNITGTAGVVISSLTMTAGSISSGDGAIIYNQKGNLTIKGAALTKGYSAAYGGAITSFGGVVTVSDTVFSDNSANSNGGAIDIAGGSLGIANCKFANNWSASNGGAVQTEAGAGTVTISGSSFGSNSTNGSGGAVYFRSGAALTVSSSNFGSNYSANGGAALHVQNSATSTTVTSSGFSSNTGKEGGAINVVAGTLSVSDSTFDGNYASGNGGALRFSVGTGKAALSNVTVSGNSAGGSGGGLWFGGSSSTTTLTNLTIADNWASTGSGLTRGGGTVSLRNTLLSNSGSNCSGTPTSLGNNLESGNTCNFVASGDIVNSSSINLATLSSNGGPTMTRALNVGSAAINAGTSTGAPSTDQRGFARVGATDIGAYEYGAGTYSISGTVFDDVNYGGGAGRSLLGSGGALVSGARVELYSSAGAYLGATTTSSVGTYTFAALTPGTYHVRVVSGSVLSTRSGSGAGLLPVQTYRTDGSAGAPAALTNHVGGTNPALADPGNGASGTTFNTSSYVFSAGLGGTAHAASPVTLGGASITGVDFGFNFDTVVNTNDSGQGSLRQAIFNANTLGGDGSLAQAGRAAAIENLVFMVANGSSSAGLRSSLNYTTGGIATIAPGSALPTIGSALVIDARTQPGWSGTPVVELKGTSAGSGSNGITLSATGCTIAGLTINRFNASGIRVLGGGGGHTMVGNWLGLNNAGTAASANGAEGLSIAIGGSNVIGGLTSGERNVMSGNGNNGLTITTGNNLIRGNYIGTNAAGTGRVANGSVGVYLGAAGNTVGGTVAGAGNVISGNTWEQLQIDSAASSTTVQGNLLGPAADGSLTLTSGGYGVWVKSGSNTIGGTTAAAANTIAGNGNKGVVVTGSTSSGNAILGNVIRRNGGIAIDLANDGGTANDGAKTAGQPNLLIDKPVFTTSAYSGSTLTVAGYVGNGAGSATFASARVEVFVADTFVAGNIQAQTYLGLLTTDASGNFSGTFSVPSGITPGTTQVVATATDGSNNTSELSAGALVAFPGAISGTVFEDVNYGGGAGRSLASSGGVGRGSATVELYDSSGAWVSSTTTASGGTYSFTSVAAGTYYVRVVSGSVSSSRYVSGTVPVGVMTYRTTASSGSAVAVTDFVGGTSPATADPGVAASGAAFSTSSFVYSAGLSGTAHAVTPVTLGASHITGVDFGFNFDTVVNTNNSGQGSLRQAMDNANTLTGDASLAQSGRTAATEHLVFMIPNGTTGEGGSLGLAAGGLRASLNAFTAGIAVMAPTSALPQIYTSMVIDARTQPGWTGSPIVELNGAGAGSGTNGLNILGVSGQSPAGFKVTVAGFVINRFSGNGIYYGWTSANGKVAGNYIGTNSAGTAASANGGAGVYIHGWVAGPTTIGGTVSTDRNLISGNGTQGIYADKDIIVQGNLIGTNAAGTLAVPNVSHGVTVRAGTHLIGGSSAAARNLISGNGGQGVNVETSSTSVVISGNYIGTNVTGSAALGNTGNGVQTAFSSGVTVGGSTPGSGNLISGNGTGGVRFNNTCAGFVVAGNIIGLNAAGTAAVANNGSGVWTFCTGATIGGASSASRNIISGNTQSGIYFASGNNVARANWIGLDASGTSVIANGQHGVYATANAVTLGGATAGMGNAIAGATGSYYAISVASSSGNSILGNTIGVQGDGVTALASPGNGILLTAVNNSTIGGVAAGSGNTIRLSAAKGIVVTGASSGNSIRGNTIYGSTGLGIDLGNDGVTANDGTTTTGQPNLKTDHPIITSATIAGTTLTVAGYVGSAANQGAFASATVDVYRSDATSSHGSGQTYLGTLTADASGNFSGSVSNVSGVASGSTALTATATDTGNNTSEFGPNVTVGRRIGGSLFEDIHYGGGAGRNKAAAAGAAIANATVELIGSDGLLKASSTTAADGSYSFTGVAEGHYFVRVPIATVRSTRLGSSNSLLGVQTYRYEASWTSPGEVTDEVGGMNPAAPDGAAGVSSYSWTACGNENATCTFAGTRLVRYGSGSTWTTRVLTGGTACSNGVFGDPLLNVSKTCELLDATPHSVSSISTLNGDVSGVDFGFNFDTVVNANDTGSGSLRQVITNANALGNDSLLLQAGRTAGLEHLVFMIPNGTAAPGLRSSLNLFTTAAGGRSLATVTLASTLPAVTGPAVVDAQTQPGFSGSPVVEINSNGFRPFDLQGSAVVLRGFVINRFGATLPVALQGSGGHSVQGLWLGLDASGTAASANSAGGLWVPTSNNLIGGTTAQHGNVIGGAGWAIQIEGTQNVVQGNAIGTDPTGVATLANGIGVRISAASGNTIGGTAAGAGNLIARNTGDGVQIQGNGSGNAVLGNIIFANGGLGIDLDTDGADVNDGNKTSGTANLKVDHPRFTSARSRGNQLTLTGYVGSAAGQATFAGSRVDIFVSDNDSSGYGEGKTYLGTLTADANGNFGGTVTMPVAMLALGTRLTATATDSSNNTSEFGPQFTNLLVDFVVNSNLDEVDSAIGDGQCLTASGVCTLRAAIAELNAWTTLPSTPTIAFALPGCSASGQAACSIAPTTVLPSVARAMAIDATTQPGWNSSTAAPLVELSGAVAPANAIGLVVGGSGFSLRGLAINRWGSHGLSLAGSGHTVAGNWFGVNASGTAAAANGGNGIEVTGTGNLIGGASLADRNVASGNTLSGISLKGSGNTVTGNVAGLLPDGSTVAANTLDGITIAAASQTIGGAAAGRGNVASGNRRNGIRLDVGSDGSLIRGNCIGVAADCSTARGNGTAVGSPGSGIGVLGGTGSQIGGTGPGEGNVIANSLNAGVGFGAVVQQVAVLGNRIYGNAGEGIRLNIADANDGVYDNSQANRGIDNPVITGAGVGDTQASLTVFGFVGTGTGQAAFAGARIEFFKAAADASGFGEGQVYLGALTADGNGRFNGTINFTAGLVAVGDAITATATDGSGNTSEFGPNWTSTTVAGLTPAGFNAFETDTAASAITGVVRSKVAGSAATLAVVALNSTGTALHAGFTGSVALSWLDARDDSGAVNGSCRASWTALGSAGTATFANNARVNVSLTPPASGTRSMRLKMTYTNGATVVTACSSDAFAALPATLTLAATDSDAATAGSARSLTNTAASGGVVHRAGRPFTVSSQARDATGAVMTGYDGTPVLAVAGCVLPAGCSAGSLSSTATAALAGVYNNATVSYAEVGAVQLQLSDASYASVDSGDTDAATRTVSSGVVGVGRFVPDSLSVAISTAGSFATANGACLASGSGATFVGQGFGWTTAPQVTVTAKNAAGNTTTLWTGTLMKLTSAAQLPGLAVSAAGTAALSSSFGPIAVSDLGGGSARLAASSLDRFLLDLPAGTVQASVTPGWTWNLAVNDASEAAVAGNPTLTASASQAGVPFDLGATFHSGRLALAAAHGDARAGVRSLVQLQRWTSAGWVTMTEDRGCITVQPQHLGVEVPSGIFASSSDCAAPMTASVTTAGGRAWIALPATPGAAPGRLMLRLAGDAASGHSCSGVGTPAALVSLARPWLTGGTSGSGPSALATWGTPNRDVVLRRETW